MLGTYYAVLGWMRWGRRYRIHELARVRARFTQLLRQDSTPMVICANHLTLIDSFLIIWALSPGWKCLLNSARFAWNLPERRNFYNNLLLRTLCYLGKCIPVVRRGPREETKRVLDRVGYLLELGQTIMIFPEGGRSRTGRVDKDNAAYGVGTILQETPDARVLCVYLRGRRQDQYSDFPVKGEEFRVELRMLNPHSDHHGLRGARDIATQIVQNLVEMEECHFGSAVSTPPSVIVSPQPESSASIPTRQ